MPVWRLALLSPRGQFEFVSTVAPRFHFWAPLREERGGHAVRGDVLFGRHARHIDGPVLNERTRSPCADCGRQCFPASGSVRSLRDIRGRQSDALRFEFAAQRSVPAAVSLRRRGLRNKQQPDVRRLLHAAHRIARHPMYLVYESPCE